MQQLKFNLQNKRTCIFDSFVVPDNDDWIWELKKRKNEIDEMLKSLGLIN